MANILDTIFTASVQLRQNVEDWFGVSACGHCRLYTTDADGILVTDDASMVSLLELHGSLQMIGDEEFEEISNKLVACLKTPLTSAGHALQILYSNIPSASREHIQQQFAPLQQTAETLHLDLKPVLDDWQDTLASYCATEKTLIAVWTRPSIMSQAEVKNARKELRKKKVPAVTASESQAINVTIERMRDMHMATVKDIKTHFDNMRYKITALGSHAALREIRKCIAPNYTSDDWRPCILGDPLPLRKPDQGKNSTDMSHILPPVLSKQLWPTQAVIHEARYVEVGELIFAPFVVRLPPQTIMPFNALFRSLMGEGIPWRSSILLTGDGMQGSAIKAVASAILSFTSAGNRAFNKSLDELKFAQLNGECTIGFQMTFCTWVNRTTPDAFKILAQRAARLRTAAQSWGSCDTTDLIGDPLLGFSATLPAYMPTSPAPTAIAPLTDAVRMLPLARPTSPWEQTDLPLRTPDGRYMPIGLFSSVMASWNEICFAGMGAGKSFFLNTLNFFFCLRPGQVRLPWLTVIDIGISCSGVITLIKAALPHELKHLAEFAQLRNTADSAINPFDTPLGCTMPLPPHQDFLLNLLALLCTPLNVTAPMDGVTGMLREAITTAYKTHGPKGSNPKKYDPHIEPEIQQELSSLSIECDAQTTWWEVAEIFFDAGKITLAVRAQRHAVPLIADIAVACNNPLIADQYRKIITQGGESVPDACSRYLTDATRDFPILANPTRFDLGAAQIVGLDLAKVTPRSGPQAERQAGIMYMMARYVGAAHFFYSLNDLDLIPKKYQDYHRPRFESLASDPKRLCYDEFHRASCADLSNPLSRQIIADLTTASRESRKQNLSIGLYSQSLNDFPKELVDLATSIYVLGAGSAQAAADIAQRFGFNNAAKDTIRRITKPTKAGANFIAFYHTAYGESIQYLTNCAGAYAKWAFSTTAEDMKIRNKLYETLGCQRALALLLKEYPDGSVKPEIERRQTRREILQGEAGIDITDEIFAELLRKA